MEDLVQILQAYKSKDMLEGVVSSAIFKKRQEEAEAVICMATSRLQVSVIQSCSRSHSKSAVV